MTIINSHESQPNQRMDENPSTGKERRTQHLQNQLVYRPQMEIRKIQRKLSDYQANVGSTALH